MKKLLLVCLTAASFAATPKGNLVAFKANKTLGIKYIWGGNSLQKGLDCSALVQQIYRRMGYNIPRTAAAQVIQTKECPIIPKLSSVIVGDALYFKNDKGKIHHVAIVSGFDKYGRPIITHAKGEKYGVVRERLADKYISEFIGAKRFYNCEGLKNKDKNKYLKPIIIKTVMQYNKKTVIKI